jgi:hypothetical protein
MLNATHICHAAGSLTCGLVQMTNDPDASPSRAGRRPCALPGRRQAATCILAALLCLASAPSSAEEKAVLPSSDLIDLIAVCTHMTYNDGAYAHQDNVLQDLRFLGIHHIRDGLPGTDSQPQLQGRRALRHLIQEKRTVRCCTVGLSKGVSLRTAR